VLLLKGFEDTISDGKRIVIVKGGSPGMTKGGTGDVLAGIVGGLIAQKISLFKAAVAGAKINKTAGKMLEKEFGYGFLASDLLDKIPKAIKKI